MPSLRLAFLALLASVFLAAPAFAAGNDPALGTWILNLSKSRFDPGPPPKSLMVRLQSDPKGVKNTTELVDADGKSSTIVYTAAYDGKEYPVTGSASVDTVLLRKHDNGKVERVDRKAGVVVQSFLRSVSEDGRTMTVTHKAKGANGALQHNRLVFDRR